MTKKFCVYCSRNPGVFPNFGNVPIMNTAIDTSSFTQTSKENTSNKLGVHFCPVERCDNNKQNVDMNTLNISKLRVINR